MNEESPSLTTFVAKCLTFIVLFLVGNVAGIHLVEPKLEEAASVWLNQMARSQVQVRHINYRVVDISGLYQDEVERGAIASERVCHHCMESLMRSVSDYDWKSTPAGEPPKVIGFDVNYSTVAEEPEHHRILEILSSFRKRLPETRVVIGGSIESGLGQRDLSEQVSWLRAEHPDLEVAALDLFDDLAFHPVSFPVERWIEGMPDNRLPTLGQAVSERNDIRLTSREQKLKYYGGMERAIEAFPVNWAPLHLRHELLITLPKITHEWSIESDESSAPQCIPNQANFSEGQLREMAGKRIFFGLAMTPAELSRHRELRAEEPNLSTVGNELDLITESEDQLIVRGSLIKGIWAHLCSAYTRENPIAPFTGVPAALTTLVISLLALVTSVAYAFHYRPMELVDRNRPFEMQFQFLEHLANHTVRIGTQLTLMILVPFLIFQLSGRIRSGELGQLNASWRLLVSSVVKAVILALIVLLASVLAQYSIAWRTSLVFVFYVLVENVLEPIFESSVQLMSQYFMTTFYREKP